MTTRSQGGYFWLVGPDGCGKSTLASAIESDDVAIHYWRVSVLPMARQIVGKGVENRVNSDPHARRPDGALRAAARLLYYAIDNLLGHMVHVRAARRAGRTIVVDRGWADMIVDPRRYGLASPRPAAILQRFLPKPDAVIVVRVDAAVAHARKPELSIAEIDRQYGAWADLAAKGLPVLYLDNSGDPASSATSLRHIVGPRRN